MWGLIQRGRRGDAIEMLIGGNILSGGARGQHEDAIVAFPISHQRDGEGFYTNNPVRRVVGRASLKRSARGNPPYVFIMQQGPGVSA
jgi:hypothetical protein